MKQNMQFHMEMRGWFLAGCTAKAAERRTETEQWHAKCVD